MSTRRKPFDTQYMSLPLAIEEELADRTKIWHFYYFAAVTIVPLLENFRNLVPFKADKTVIRSIHRPPEEYITPDDFDTIISGMSLLIRYYREGGLFYEGKEINFEHGDTILVLTNALHLFVNILPYLNDRHFHISEEYYKDTTNGIRHCSLDELRNLDKTIAQRIYPTLQEFATLSVFTPQYFKRMYYAYPLSTSARLDERYNFSHEWDKALESMVESWHWILERKPRVTNDGFEDVPEKIYYGLHLFAEYLPEMHND